MTAYTTQNFAYTRGQKFKVKNTEDIVKVLQSTYRVKIVHLGHVKKQIRKFKDDLDKVVVAYFDNPSVIKLIKQINEYYEQIKDFGDKDIFIANNIEVVPFMDQVKGYELIDFSKYKKEEYFIVNEQTTIIELMYFITRMQFANDYGQFILHLGA